MCYAPFNHRYRVHTNTTWKGCRIGRSGTLTSCVWLPRRKMWNPALTNNARGLPLAALLLPWGWSSMKTSHGAGNRTMTKLIYLTFELVRSFPKLPSRPKAICCSRCSCACVRFALCDLSIRGHRACEVSASRWMSKRQWPSGFHVSQNACHALCESTIWLYDDWSFSPRMIALIAIILSALHIAHELSCESRWFFFWTKYTICSLIK